MSSEQTQNSYPRVLTTTLQTYKANISKAPHWLKLHWIWQGNWKGGKTGRQGEGQEGRGRESGKVQGERHGLKAGMHGGDGKTGRGTRCKTRRKVRKGQGEGQ